MNVALSLEATHSGRVMTHAFQLFSDTFCNVSEAVC